MRSRALYAGSPGTTLDDLLTLKHQLRYPEQQHRQGLSELPGKVASRRRGNGLDFHDLRQYQPGDNIRHIDWSVTARTQKPHIRLYREDRERAVTVAVDLRPSMFTGSSCYLADRALRLAALTLWHACQNGDRCAAVIYDHAGLHISRSRVALRGTLDALGLMAQRYAAADASAAEDPPLNPWMEHLTRSRRAMASVIVFSALDNPGPSFDVPLQRSLVNPVLHVVAVSDPLETVTFPSGRFPFRHRDQSHQISLNRRTAAKLRRIQAHNDDRKLTPWRDMHPPVLREKDIPDPATLPQLLQQQGAL